MVIVVTIPMIPHANRGYVGWQFPNPWGGPVKIPNTNPSS